MTGNNAKTIIRIIRTGVFGEMALALSIGYWLLAFLALNRMGKERL